MNQCSGRLELSHVFDNKALASTAIDTLYDKNVTFFVGNEDVWNAPANEKVEIVLVFQDSENYSKAKQYLG